MAAPQGFICVHSKYTYETETALYPQSYPDVNAEILGLNRTTPNYLDTAMNAP